MPSPVLERLTAEFPAERDALTRLVGHIEAARGQGNDRPRSLPVKRMFEIAEPSSQLALVQILGRLVTDGVLTQVVRFEPEPLSGGQEFSSIAEVPPIIHDKRRDLDVEVKPEHLRLYYKF